jgi:hypothetical protein
MCLKLRSCVAFFWGLDTETISLARAAGRKLKVFEARFGFYDTVVAAPSQAAALRAWDTHQNLFASGDARVTDDKDAVAAALEHPQTPLRRAVGSHDPFLLQPKSLPTVPDGPRKKAPAVPAKAKPKLAPRVAPDRSKLKAAESALRDLDEKRKQEEAALRRDAEALEARRSAAQAAYIESRKAATAAVQAAREDYRKAGGTD